MLRYLLDFPAAKDTVEGIGTWWLCEEADVQSMALRQALEELAEKNWLIVRPMARVTGEPEKVYGMNPAEIDAIRSFIATAAAAGDEDRPGAGGAPAKRGYDG